MADDTLVEGMDGGAGIREVTVLDDDLAGERIGIRIRGGQPARAD